MQSELENLSFMYTNAEDYAKVKRRAAELYKEHEKEVLEVMLSSYIEMVFKQTSRKVVITCFLFICAFLRCKKSKC